MTTTTLLKLFGKRPPVWIHPHSQRESYQQLKKWEGWAGKRAKWLGHNLRSGRKIVMRRNAGKIWMDYK